MPENQYLPEDTIEIDTNRQAATASGDLLNERVRKSRDDRVFLCRCTAIFLIALAIANVIPAAMHLYENHEYVSGSIARWVYLQLFVAFLHGIYAILVLQICDWSTLRSASIFTLIFAAAFGFIAVSLLLSGGDGPVARILELPFSLVPQAMVWSVTMLLLLLAGSFIAGVEAANWKKMERLFLQVSKTDSRLGHFGTGSGSGKS